MKKRTPIKVRTRAARLSDLDCLCDFESRAFSVDHLSRRSFRHLLGSKQASMIVAEAGGGFAGYALVLFRRKSRVARLYSIGVDRHLLGRGVGKSLMAAAERIARQHSAHVMRLEVQVKNKAAIAAYEKRDYRLFGRHEAYYDDGSAALRYEKRLAH